ncbi:flavin monoamine oxidase family protein [Actinocorallia sp. A-T 12471]|uniref:flavin monoamine oxidase family protein n=1 Tax=Actinocorallia sp. A-T 12471 TaxID=3089813 RepID=UPI0029CD36F9|nr:FAD-dependent oxidoreductase [Actinocorallia sp. A-T 12471]MDX6743090.1 FAD-dependent oxidoreductase [Actinocorallia sp. A-T 12471]
MTSLSRRRMLGGAVASAASLAALPSSGASAAPGDPGEPVEVDVCVVGGGLSGLTAARDIVAAGKSVVVLEGRDRAGGRVYGMTLGDGSVTEGGAEFIGPTQDRVSALAQSLGVTTFATYNTGKNVYFRNNKRSTYATDGLLGAVPPDWGVLDLEIALSRLRDMASKITPGQPWAAASAEEWDSQTFHTWSRANTISSGARFLLDAFVSSTLSVRSKEVSLLYVLNYIASAGNATSPGSVDRLINTAGGGQESRVVGGSQEIPLRLATQLGARVRLNTRVRRVTVDGPRVLVESDGYQVSAKRVIVAMSPSQTAGIEFRPGLPAARAQLVQRFPMGSVAKFVAVYPTPFWRAEGLTGQAVADSGAIDATFDNSPPDGSRGLLMGFVNQTNMRKLHGKPDAEIAAACLASFTKLFGAQAASPIEYAYHLWDADPLSGGGPTGIAPPGVLTEFGAALRTPCGPVHWAGTETSDYWTGYMDGAVRSGERAATEVIPLV